MNNYFLFFIRKSKREKKMIIAKQMSQSEKSVVCGGFSPFSFLFGFLHECSRLWYAPEEIVL